jgi:hypothetical protein
MEKSISFLTSAIEDTQNIIRAIDIKMQIAFGILIVPATNVGDIITTSVNLFSAGGIFLKAVVVCFFVIWLIALYICLKCLAGIGNPIPHIKNDKDVSGTFYLGDQFKFGFTNCFYNQDVSSKDSINSIFGKIPKTDELILGDLTYEMMKVTYIRELKLIRQRWVFRFTMAWSILAILVFVLGGLCSGANV